MNVSVVIPQSAVPQEITDIKTWVIQSALGAAKMGLAPIPFPKGGPNHNLKFYLNQAHKAAFSGRPQDMPMSAYVAGLVHAKLRHDRNAAAPAKHKADLPDGLRDEQRRLIERVEAKMGEGRIILAEAGTGVGKTRAALVMAVRRPGRSLIAVPTLAVLAHVLAEYATLTEQRSLGFIIGRTNFVSPSKLQDVLDQPEDIPEDVVEQARAWYVAGGPYTEGAKTQSLHAIRPLAWLAEDLQQAAPGFPVENVVLSAQDEEDCPAQAMYQSLHEDIHNADIIVCTHAMLALHAMLGENILPPYDTLWVDEAHLLEKHIANMCTYAVSPRALIHRLDQHQDLITKAKKKTLAQELRRYLKDLHDHALVIGQLTDNKNKIIGYRERIRLNGMDAEIGVRETLMPHFNNLQKSIKNIKALYDIAPDLRTPLVHLQYVLKHVYSDYGDGVWLSFSPRKRFPSLVTGPYSVRHILERIWNQSSLAVLLSATLSLPDSMGIPKYHYIMRTLGIPASRMATIDPIHPRWLYTPEVIIYARPEYYLKDSTPEEGDQPNATMLAWGKTIAQALLSITRKARGGVLVLTTSYARIQALAEGLLALDKQDALAQRLVIQRRDLGVRYAHAEFMRKQAMRPIWLAAGPAWTGIDIRAGDDVPPEDDWVLTDVVIVNLPLGTNRSTTHATRVERSFTNETYRAALEFRQGLGRLMRHQGVKDRRLWILDPRIQRKEGIFIPFRRIIGMYRSVIHM